MAKAELIRGNSDIDSFRAAVAQLNAAATELMSFGSALKQATEIRAYKAAGLEEQAAAIYEVQAGNVAAIEDPMAKLNKTLSNAISGMEIAEKQAESNTLNTMLD